MLDISRKDWDDHLAEDDARGQHINELRLAMFGDPENPETVKVAVMPTMQRLNNYLDGLVWGCKAVGGLILVVAAVVGMAKSLGVL